MLRLISRWNRSLSSTATCAYPNRQTGNHAAFFLRHAAPGQGFYVIDQWIPKRGHGEKPYISSRQISSKRRKQNADGSRPNASDNADAFSVIE